MKRFTLLKIYDGDYWIDPEPLATDLIWDEVLDAVKYFELSDDEWDVIEGDDE